MKAIVLGLLAETGIHAGVESSGGPVDLPVAREAGTNYPVLPGSSMKGVLRDKAERSWRSKEAVNKLFGMQNSGGGFGITDARLLLLPIRSLTGHYVWVTCPYILARLLRDLKLAGQNVEEFNVEQPGKDEVFTLSAGTLYLEELTLTAQEKPELIQVVAKAVSGFVAHQSVRKRLAEQVVVVSDARMSYFASYCLPVRARNVLDDETKISKNLWYEEFVPADTLFYSLILQRPEREGDIEQLAQLFAQNPYIQIGGNETVGQGWCIASVIKEG